MEELPAAARGAHGEPGRRADPRSEGRGLHHAGPHCLKTALVTGAARGIGRATADALRDAGCKVIGLDREQCDVVYDLSDIAGIARLVDSLGPVDILVNNAGVQDPAPQQDYTQAAPPPPPSPHPPHA